MKILCPYIIFHFLLYKTNYFIRMNHYTNLLYSYDSVQRTSTCSFLYNVHTYTYYKRYNFQKKSEKTVIMGKGHL